MPDITQRIADILNKHTPSGATGLVNCWCGIADFHTFGQQAAHVAEVLVSELGLTQQRIALGVDGWTAKPLDGIVYVERQSRYVTDWVPE